MAYILNQGLGPKHIVYSLCSDISYAQAENVFLAEKIKKKDPSALIVGLFDKHPSFPVEKFIASYSTSPADLARVEEIRSEILSKGFDTFMVKPYGDGFDLFMKSNPKIDMSPCVSTLADQYMVARATGGNLDIAEVFEDIYANPLHAGIHIKYPATVVEEIWISDAVKAMRRTSQDRWLRRMLSLLRFYWKGSPLIPLPNKNDRCLCGSTKKYGKCCGYDVEPEDPEDCKLGRHQYSVWEEVSGKLIRTCNRCYRIHEAPWTDESVVDKIRILLVGCRACSSRPSVEEIQRELKSAADWHKCGSCGKEFILDRVLIEHEWADGKHANRWVATEIHHKEESVDLESKEIGKGVFLHKACFIKAMPAWPKVAKATANKGEPGISRDVTPAG